MTSKDLITSVAATLFEFAKTSDKTGNARVAAALVNKNDIIIGRNSSKTHPFQKKYAKNVHAISIHAETSAIVKALNQRWTMRDIQRSTLVIVRVKESSKGNFHMGLAKPCCGCERCIIDFGIKSVYYSTNENTLETL